MRLFLMLWSLLLCTACVDEAGGNPDVNQPVDVPDQVEDELDALVAELAANDPPDVSDDVAITPTPIVVGMDLDIRTSRSLLAEYDLPAQFYELLEKMELPVEWLIFSDFGLTYEYDTSRLHWTDKIRHQGHKAPVFAHMVIGDVQEAVELGDNDDAVRRLLAAMHTYNQRDEFVRSHFDKQYVVSDFDTPLLDALKVHYERAPLPGNPGPPTEAFANLKPQLLEQLSGFPVETRVALALAIYGLTDAAEMRNQALLGLGKLDWKGWAKHHGEFLKGFNLYSASVQNETYPAIDFELMNRAGQLAVRSLESLRMALAGLAPVDGAVLDFKGPYGRVIVDLTSAANAWEGDDVFLLVDGSGDDTYLGMTAANSGIYYPVAAVLDLAGNDTYLPSDGWEFSKATVVGARTPMQGAGIYGLGILSDAAGDDIYRAASASQGWGVFGVGVLMDHGGADSYEGYDYCLGSSEFGYGLLYDTGGGNDNYKTLQHSLGYGGPRGMGFAVDTGGDDTYLAFKEPIIFDWAGEGTNFSGSLGFAFGWRAGPYWSGGLGAAFDLGGNDSYECAVMCLGFGYFFGTGLFYDQSGDDDYKLTHKYGIGAATHQSVGLFEDGDGADTYVNTGDDESIGLGYDHGVAFHIDRGDQDDHYEIENHGDFVFGFARHPSMGVLINEGGNDTYIVPGNGNRSLGRSEVNKDDRNGPGAGIISLGMFLDLGGPDDAYVIEREEVQNNAQWNQTEPLGQAWTPTLDFAVGLDSE